MFGLLQPCSRHLDAELRDQWRAHLCGLCLTLRDRHGQTSRCATNTDAVTISILTAAQRPTPLTTTHAGPCPLRGMRSAQVIPSDDGGAALAATTSLTLAAAKTADQVGESAAAISHQSRSTVQVARLIGPAITSRALSDTRYAALIGADATIRFARRQAGVEAQSTTLDQITDFSAASTARVFAATAAVARTPENSAALHDIGDAFGRCAHLLDAVTDYAVDRQRGDFNPLQALKLTPADGLAECRRLQHVITDRYADLRLYDERLLRIVLLGGLHHAVHRAQKAVHGAGAAPQLSQGSEPTPLPGIHPPAQSLGETFLSEGAIGDALKSGEDKKHRDWCCWDRCDCCDCCDCCEICDCCDCDCSC